jgi:uncharacterized protein (DUF58 family)
MIVPSSRLLLGVAIAAVPLAGLAGAAPEAAPFAAGALGLLVAAAAADAVLASRSLSGVQVSLPALVRLAQGRDGALDVRILRSGFRPRRLRLALALPEGIGSPSDDREVELPPDGQAAQFAWPCRGVRRGRFFVDRCYLEAASPLGLWAYRAAAPSRSELRVYPNLLAERRDVAAILLRRGLAGIHAQRQVGKGREFDKLREYVPGDAPEDIHWKATAKRGVPITKLFQVERTQDVYAVLDASRLSGRTPDALDRAVTAALVLAVAAEQQGDRFGLATFSDRVLGFLRTGKGRSHFNACRDLLYTLIPKRVSPDFDEIGAFLRRRVRTRALVIFLTDLDDPVLAESFTRAIEPLRRQHVVLVGMRRPEGAVPLFTGPRAATPDDVSARLAGHLSWRALRELQTSLERRGVDLALFDKGEMTAGLVARYLRIKQRQLL